MKLSTKIKLSAAFAVALLLIIGTGIFSWSSTATLVGDAEMVSHTHEVIQHLEHIVSQLKDAETGQRGFVITGAPRYLEPYNAGIEGVVIASSEVRDLTSDNLSQQERLDVLDPLIQSKLDELGQTIALRRDVGFDSARDLVLTDSGKRIMDDLRVVIAEMELEERQLLEQRAAATAATATKTKTAIVFGTLVATAIFSVIALTLFRTNSKLGNEVQERLLAEKSILAEKERFRDLVETIPNGVLEVDASQTILFANSAHYNQIGYTAAELIALENL